MLRRTLTRHRANEVTLGEELELVEQYVAIEQARFSDRLRPEFTYSRLAACRRRCRVLRCNISSKTRSDTASHDNLTPVSCSLLPNASGDLLQLTVIDDGVGIDPEARAAAGSRHREHARAPARALRRTTPRSKSRGVLKAVQSLPCVCRIAKWVRSRMVKQARWKALIADDEPAARRGVRQLLAAFPEFVVAGECRNGAEVLAALDTSPPDVVFLDIQMPGIDGFEVIKRRTVERMPAVVFLTAFDQFAIRAFETEALDYLVKPVSEARFAATMKRSVEALAIDVDYHRAMKQSW